MPFVDNSDPNALPGEYTSLPDGTYEVNGIDGWFPKSLDDQGLPFYKEVNGELRALFNFKMADSSRGPAGSMTAPELAALVVGFGADATQLPADRNSAAYLVKAKELINNSGKKIQVKVDGGKGWVQYVPSAMPKTGIEGIYQLVLDRLYSLDGTEPVAFQVDKFDNSAVGALYRIASMADGSPTVFEGYPIKEKLYDPFDGTAESEYGTVPKFRVNQNNSRPSAVSRFINFYSFFCDAERLEQHMWTVEELRNPLTVVIKYLVPGKRIKAMLDLTDGAKTQGVKRLKIDLLKVSPVDGVNTPVAAPVTSKPTSSSFDAPASESSVTKLIKLVGDQCRKETGAEAFDSNNGLTVEGSAWAKANLVEDWIKVLGPNADRKFATLEEGPASLLFTHFNAKFNGLPDF